MKKYILILLLTVAGYGQTLQNPTFGNTTTNTLKIKTPATVTSVNFLSTVEADGSIAKIAPVNLGFASDANVIHKTGDETKTGELAVTTTTKANGEQFYSSSGGSVEGISSDVIESQSGGTGIDYTPSATVTALKFTTSSTVSYIQGILLKVKKNSSLSTLSTLTVKLYSDNSGVPNVQIGSSATIYGGQTSTSFQDFILTFQNISNPLSPSTVYWAVITRVESGGNFVLNSQNGTGTTFQGTTAPTATVDTAIQLYNIIYARSNYGGHFVAKNSHGIWATSISGVGVRGDGVSHYGGYFASLSGDGANGNSVYGNGLVGISTNSNGVLAQTYSTAGFPAFRADNNAGITYLAAYINGRSQLLGRTTIGAGTDWGATFEASGTARITGNLLLKNTGVTYASQDTGERLQVDGAALISGVTTITTTSQQSLTAQNNLSTLDNRFRNIAGTSIGMIQTFGQSHATTPNLTTLSSTGDLALVTGGVRSLHVTQTSRTLLGVNPTDNGVDRLQVTGTIAASPALTAGQVVVKSQLDLKADNLLTGYVSGAGTVLNTDTVLQAIQKLNGNISALGTQPLRYKALISQTGTSAPTVTVLENTLGTVTYGYSGVGVYTASSSALFTTNKTFIMVNPAYGNGNVAAAKTNTSSIIDIRSGNGLVPTDGILSTFILIEVYP